MFATLGARERAEEGVYRTWFGMESQYGNGLSQILLIEIVQSPLRQTISPALQELGNRFLNLTILTALILA